MKIIIGSDHNGYELKSLMVSYLKNSGHEIKDVGAFEYNRADDYPDFVSMAVSMFKQEPDSLVILICKNGVGVSMMANKYPDMRCGLCFSPKHASSARNDDHINTLALPAEYIDTKAAYKTVRAFLDTPYSTEERHLRRLSKLTPTTGLDPENR